MAPRKKSRATTKRQGSTSGSRGRGLKSRPPRKGKVIRSSDVRRKPTPPKVRAKSPKRPWYDRIKDPAARYHWRQVEAQWKEDAAREAAEREINADKKRAFKIVKWHEGLTGKGARLLSAVVGRDVYNTAEVRYGGALLKRAALKLEAIRKDREKVRKAALAKISGALKQKGFSMEEVERFQLRVHPKFKLRVRHFFQIRRGKFKGMFEEVDQQTKKRLRIIKTRAGLERARTARKHRQRAAEVANQLGLTFTQARVLVREVEAQAVLDLHALKRTKAFKDLPKRKQKAYTERRWMAGSVAVLYALADIEGYR